MDVRVLIDRTGETPSGPSGELGDRDLEALYAAPRLPWLGVNMIGTVDGAATGPDGRSGTINNPADHRVFRLLRRLADVIVVGAGTARAEEYHPAAVPIVVVSRRGEVPPSLRGAPPGAVLLGTCARAPGLAAARDLLGDAHVLRLGESSVDPGRLREALVARGHRRLLAEGGPSLLRDLLTHGVVDELTTTVVPRVIGGEHPRIVAGPPLDVPLDLRLLLEDDGTLLARWWTRPRPAGTGGP